MNAIVQPHLVCDCHIHSFCKSEVPQLGAYYVPPQKNIADFIVETNGLNVKRAVVIQASVDGVDNSRLIRLLQQSHEVDLRAVVTVQPSATKLEELCDAGIRALRIQDRRKLGASQLGHLTSFSTLAAKYGWHLELNTEPESFGLLADMLPKLPRQQIIVLDHMGHIDPENSEQINQLCRLMDSGRVWVKLSPTRVTRSGKVNDYSDIASVVLRLAQRFPRQCVWGSDWPHVMTAYPLPRYSDMLSFFLDVLGQELFGQCVWSNADKLYWQPPS